MSGIPGITKTYNDSTVLQFREDGWFNMTKAANAFGKRLDNFWTAEGTKPYCDALSNSHLFGGVNRSQDGPLPRRHMGTPQAGRVLRPLAGHQVLRLGDAVIDDILRGKAEVVITKPETSEIMKMPTSLLEAGELWNATSLGVMPGIPVITPRCPPPTPWATLSSCQVPDDYARS